MAEGYQDFFLHVERNIHWRRHHTSSNYNVFHTERQKQAPAIVSKEKSHNIRARLSFSPSPSSCTPSPLRPTYFTS
jgi:pentose-5-phosphate-3-epimerase